MYKHHPIGIQFFAEPTEQQEQEPQTHEDTEHSGEQPSFDDLLKGGYQAEFDRRITKALNTARTKWEQEQAEGQDEAKKLERMTAAQREKYQLDKDRQALNAERAAFARQQLEVQTGAQLQSMGYDAAFARYLTGQDAEATSANLTAFDELMQAYKAGAVKNQMRGGGAPKEPKPSSDLTRESLRGMTRQEISKAFDAGELDALLKSK